MKTKRFELVAADMMWLFVGILAFGARSYELFGAAVFAHRDVLLC